MAILAKGTGTAAAVGAWRRVLVVMPGYMASPTSGDVGSGSLPLMVAGAVWRGLTRENHRAWVRFYRDFYANPRDPAYMGARLSTLFAEHCPGASVVLVGPGGAIDAVGEAGWLQAAIPLATNGKDPADCVAALGDAIGQLSAVDPFDAVLIVHPDAIGLGQEAVENVLAGRWADRLFALSGRRRLRRLDGRQRRRFRRRRFFAETRIVESWIARGLWVMASVLAVRDRLAGVDRS